MYPGIVGEFLQLSRSNSPVKNLCLLRLAIDPAGTDADTEDTICPCHCSGDSRLHAAAGSNDVSEIKALVAAGASLEEQLEGGVTPLHAAASAGHAEAANALVAAGASLEAQINVRAADKSAAILFRYMCGTEAHATLLSAAYNTRSRRSAPVGPLWGRTLGSRPS